MISTLLTHLFADTIAALDSVANAGTYRHNNVIKLKHTPNIHNDHTSLDMLCPPTRRGRLDS